MGKLSLKSYGWKCILGGEIAYVLCLLGGLLPLRSVQVTELHHMFFETLPGFTWLNVNSFFLGAVYVFIGSWVIAWYYVWMHNSSLEGK
ncbi:MAG: hypothetical protein AAB611_00355 [Patescibacteria group bacterium]